MDQPYVAKITSKGQITLPKPLREALGLADGDLLLVYVEGRGVRLEKAAVSTSEEFLDLARRTEVRWRNQGVTAADVEEAIGWARRGDEPSSTRTS
ncbi:MAG TPA: AbrB/MazE/SpoVT family DNA-binding domain-containing protein [Bacillota bacterium]|nr:AbrB/MazE/SpoVT family DNA-binding domain-containing protein [Bacillota bacterium]